MSQHLLSANEILDDSGMGSDEAYYAGCSAKLRSVNGVHLHRIYKMLLATQGAEVADSFTQMILEMENLAPQLVIRAVKELERRDWKFSQELDINRTPYIPSPRDPVSEAQFSLGNVGLLFGSGPDETEDIKEDFKQQLLGQNPPEIVPADCKICQRYRERGCLENPKYHETARRFGSFKKVNRTTAKFLKDGCCYWEKEFSSYH